MNKSIYKSFLEYVSLNILGMIGLSCYILADTFFISKALGAVGIAALNFSIPIYSVVHGIGLMIAMGGATRFSILKAQKDPSRADMVFTHSAGIGLLLGIVFMILGMIGSQLLAEVLGADHTTLGMTNTYLKTILSFSPLFILNNIVLAFVRNDNNPNLSMIAMLIGSFSNIILDYIFMFPMDLGMFGAAFATGLAPMISMGVLSIHFMKKKNSFRLTRGRVHLSILGQIFGLGLSSFINEVSSAVVLITFNLVILGLKGNIGVASYGIVANIALVGIAVFTGIAQGIQPLVSKEYGARSYERLKMIIKLALPTSLVIAGLIYISIFSYADRIVGVFNSEQNLEIAQMAKEGLRVYFLGFFFAGINIIMATYYSATEQARDAFVISITRGFVIIIPFVLILSRLWSMTGVWVAFVLTEGVVTILAVYKGKKLAFKESI